MSTIAQRIYTAAQVRQLEQLSMQHAGIAAYTLMTQAGQAVFDFIRQRWVTARSLCVVCGAGNNAGDGYVVARLALQAGWQVQVIAVVDPSRLGGTAQLRSYLQHVDVIAIGPGLGQHAWGRGLLRLVLTTELPKVLDADALNLLAQACTQRNDWILTPHPGEAARLLGCSVGDIEQDRVAAARRLQREYGGVIVLKGAGTLVASADRVGFCLAGNPGMAVAGMGDTLTGIIAGLLAQGLSLTAAAETAVWVHARAADVAALQGERGLLASDLLAVLRAVINDKEASDG